MTCTALAAWPGEVMVQLCYLQEAGTAQAVERRILLQQAVLLTSKWRGCRRRK